MKNEVFIIVPAYNESPVIAGVLKDLLGTGYSIIVIDDSSTDDTGMVVQEFPVYYLRHKVNMGQGAALQTGITFALQKGADYFVTFDADGQHIAEDIQVMLASLYASKADIVFGSRFVGESKSPASLTRKSVLQGARFLNFLLTGILLSDAHNGLRVFNRKTASLFDIRENRMAHATELLMKVAKYKLKYKEVSVHINYTSYSMSKGQKNFHSFKVLQDILLYKFFK